MLILKGHWNDRIYLALCEEVKRTPQRVYVKVLQGDRQALESWRGDAGYAPLTNVLSFVADEQLFCALQQMTKTHAIEIKEMTRALSDARLAHVKAIQELADMHTTLVNEVRS